MQHPGQACKLHSLEQTTRYHQADGSPATPAATWVFTSTAGSRRAPTPWCCPERAMAQQRAARRGSPVKLQTSWQLHRQRLTPLCGSSGPESASATSLDPCSRCAWGSADALSHGACACAGWCFPRASSWLQLVIQPGGCPASDAALHVTRAGTWDINVPGRLQQVGCVVCWLLVWYSSLVCCLPE